MPKRSYEAYKSALLGILHDASAMLDTSCALDVATYAVSLLELNPLFNAGRGAVYTTAGTHELEASVMVSSGYRKRGVGVMKVRGVKHPIKLAREMLVQGEKDDGGGARGHAQLEGETCLRLARRWGLEMVRPSWYWTRRRWDEHRRGLGLDCDDDTYEKNKKAADEGWDNMADDQPKSADPCQEQDADGSAVGDIHWDGKVYLPQGTVGAVVLDSFGVLCVATSTGGLTNKLPGRIGDTPTLGAGFWAEEFYDDRLQLPNYAAPSPIPPLSEMIGDCLPSLSGYLPVLQQDSSPGAGVRAVAMSGTGNGDSFLRTAAARSAAAIARYSSKPALTRGGAPGMVSLQEAVRAVAGPGGQLQRSAGDRWGKTGEGEGGIIGLELINGKGRVVFDFNCGGMFHAWIDDDGKARFELFQDGPRPPL